MAGLASAVESHGKRKELALYCFPRALQIGWNMLIKANVVTPIKNGEFIFLSLTVTCLFYMFQNHKEAIPPSHYRFLQRILGALWNGVARNSTFWSLFCVCARVDRGWSVILIHWSSVVAWKHDRQRPLGLVHGGQQSLLLLTTHLFQRWQLVQRALILSATLLSHEQLLLRRNHAEITALFRRNLG